MSTLLDTNILTRLAQPSNPHHAFAESATLALKGRGELLCIVPQNLYEFWAVATRPIIATNGLGLTVVQAKAEIARIIALFRMFPDTPTIYTEWLRLVETHDVKGNAAHDARLVAAMTVHGVAQILTFNGRDFSRYGGVHVTDPLSFAAQP
jgi:predicted nucleic acid-binding protein